LILSIRCSQTSSYHLYRKRVSSRSCWLDPSSRRTSPSAVKRYIRCKSEVAPFLSDCVLGAAGSSPTQEESPFAPIRPRRPWARSETPSSTIAKRPPSWSKRLSDTAATQGQESSLHEATLTGGHNGEQKRIQTPGRLHSIHPLCRSRRLNRGASLCWNRKRAAHRDRHSVHGPRLGPCCAKPSRAGSSVQRGRRPRAKVMADFHARALAILRADRLLKTVVLHLGRAQVRLSAPSFSRALCQAPANSCRAQRGNG